MNTVVSNLELHSFALGQCSYDEFRRKAHLVPIVAARGKSGAATNGAVRWMCRDNYEAPDSLGTLRQFFKVCAAQLQRVEGKALSESELNAFLSSSVSRFLDPAHTPVDVLYYCIGPDNHTLILYRDDRGPLIGHSREAIIATVWHVEQDGRVATEATAF